MKNSSWLGMWQSTRRRIRRALPTNAEPRRPVSRRLGVEALEDREVLSGSPLAADADRSLTTVTKTTGVLVGDPTLITNTINANNARITNLEIQSTSPLLMTASMVENTGQYAKAWWWYYGLTAGEVSAKLTQNQARLQDLEAYTVGGQTRYATVMVANTGRNAKAWWWYTGVSATFLNQKVAQNQARLIDIDNRVVNGVRVYDAILVRNSGVDARAWWYYYNRTPAQVTALLNANKARLIDIEPVTGSTYDVVMVKNTAPTSDQWYWYYGRSLNQISADVQRNGSRLVDLDRNPVNNTYTAIMINNSNALTTRIGNLLRAASASAQVGVYLKQVGGPVLAELQGFRQFEPASMIKALLLAHTLKAVQNGQVNLNDLYDFYYKPGDNIANLEKGNPDVNPDGYAETTSNRITEPLKKILERMMERSDNRATRTIDKLFGREAINATAQALQMNRTVFASTLGSGIVGNFLNLFDIGRLYEKIADGSFLGTGVFRDEFYKRMTDWNNSDKEDVGFGEGVFARLAAVVLEEAAAKLRVSTTSPAAVALRNQFVAQMKQVWKGGGYTLSATGTLYRKTLTTGGWVSLPFKQNGTIVPRGYVYGLYLENGLVPKTPANNPANTALSNAWSNGQAELFRDQIRAALSTW